MIVAALAAALTAAPSGLAPTATVHQATATVRIVCGAHIRFGDPTPARGCQGDRPQRHERRVRERDGSLTAATLVEFP